MNTTPKHDLGLVGKIGDRLIADADLPFATRALKLIDAISEHESETGRAWWWREVADGETIPVGCPVRMEPTKKRHGSRPTRRAAPANVSPGA